MRCEKCNHFYFTDFDERYHTCYEFFYQIKDWHGDDDWDSSMWARNHETVAEKAGEDHWSEEPSDPNNWSAEIWVKKGEDGDREIRKFKIKAEPKVDFYADEI